MPLFIFNFSMKKFFGYSLVFFLIIFIPVPFINIFQAHYNPTPEFYKLQYDAVQNTSGPFEGIIIGSSQPACAIRPSVLDSTGISFYNFSLPAATPEFYLTWYNEVFLRNHHSPEYCIMGISWAMFDTHLLFRKFEQDSEFFTYSLFLKMLLGQNNLSKKDIVFNRFPFLKYRTKIRDSFIWNEMKNNGNPVNTYDRGYNSVENSYDKKNFNANKRCKIYPGQVTSFIKLLEQMRTEKVKIIFVMTPEYGLGHEFYDKSKALAIINKVSKTYNIPVLNFNTTFRSHVNEDTDFFADWQHLNGKGSMIFSKQLTKELCKVIN